MQRGSRSVYGVLFADDNISSVSIAKPERKGRSEILILQRNDLLISRYFYYAKIMGKKYGAVLQTLERELFLSQRTITDILQERTSILKDLLKEQPTVKQLADKYPMMVWKEPAKPTA